MYIALLAFLIAAGGALTINGVQRERLKNILAGVSLLVLTVLFFGLLDFWGEMLGGVDRQPGTGSSIA